MCSTTLTLADVFVGAGQVMPEAAREVARSCPVRREEVIFAYGRDLRWGYFGALSPGQRKAMTLDEALDYVAADTPPRPRG